MYARGACCVVVETVQSHGPHKFTRVARKGKISEKMLSDSSKFNAPGNQLLQNLRLFRLTPDPSEFKTRFLHSAAMPRTGPWANPLMSGFQDATLD